MNAEAPSGLHAEHSGGASIVVDAFGMVCPLCCTS